MDYKRFTALIAGFLLTGAAAAYGADFLYTPQPATATDTEGILVREVTVKRGDTLSHLSKQFSGRGYYYPQILLFNNIKNPHRITPGQVVRVPVGQRTAAVQSTAASATVAEAREAAVVPSPEKSAKKSSRGDKKTSKKARQTQPDTTAEQEAFSAAQAAFSSGDCERAISLFDRFITRYPSSARLAEVTLNRAECYLKLSEN